VCTCGESLRANFIARQVRPVSVLAQDPARAARCKVMPILSLETVGAGEGNRSLVCSLGSWAFINCRKALAAKPREMPLNGINRLLSFDKTKSPTRLPMAAALFICSHVAAFAYPSQAEDSVRPPLACVDHPQPWASARRRGGSYPASRRSRRCEAVWAQPRG
jgi:hypothetical protein